MSIITLPDFCVASFKWAPRRNEITGRSSFGSQSIEVATPLWVVAMTGVPEYWRDAIQIQTVLESIAGSRNQVAAYNRVQPVPFGTLRGSWVLGADADDGDLTLVVDAGVGQAGQTLLQGDLVGIGTGITQQVVRVAADAVADGLGVISIPLNSPLRGDFLAGAEVVWDKPRALFRQLQDNTGIEYVPMVGQPWSLDLIEDWRP